MPSLPSVDLMQSLDEAIDIPDDDTTAQWVESEWLRQGRTYPGADTPACILNARRNILSVPTHLLYLLPDLHYSVMELLQKPLPKQPSTLIGQDAAASFSILPPTEDLPAIATRPLPPSKHLGNLHSAFGQAWFDGARSVVDWRYKDSRLPLYTLTYWMEMEIAADKQAQWRRSEEWLGRWGERVNIKATDEARDALQTLGWNSDYRALDAASSVAVLALLVSDEWLNDDIIDMFMSYFGRQARLDSSLRRSVVVAPLAFSHAIASAAAENTNGSRYGELARPLLKHYKALLSEHGRSDLYFPVNVDQQHWVALHVDFNKKTISYGMYIVEMKDAVTDLVWTGDSLNVKRMTPRLAISALQDWLHHDFGGRFRDAGNTMRHGLQEDDSSCGICMINTFAHALFGEELFRHGIRRRLRIQYFNILARAHGNYVHDSLRNADQQAMLLAPLTVHPDTLPVRKLADFECTEARPSSPGRTSEVPPVLQGMQLSIPARSQGPAPKHGITTGKQITMTPTLCHAGVSPYYLPEPIIASECGNVPVAVAGPSPTSPAPRTSLAPADPAKRKREGDDSESSSDSQQSPSLDHDHARYLKRSRIGSPACSAASPVAEHQDLSSRGSSSGPLDDSEAQIVDDTDRDGLSSSDESSRSDSARQSRSRSGAGTSASMQATRRLKSEMGSGSFIVNPAKLANFKRAIRVLDELAGVDLGAKWRVFHTRCAKWVTMAEAYSVTKFRTHVRDCKATPGPSQKLGRRTGIAIAGPAASSKQKGKSASGTVTRPMTYWAQTLGWTKKSREPESSIAAKEPAPRIMAYYPCGGITKLLEPLVPSYLHRTGAQGGGARSQKTIAEERFGKTYSKLSKAQKLVADQQKRQEEAWLNDHGRQVVFASACLRMVPAYLVDGNPESPGAVVCPPCRDVANSKPFKTIVRKQVPDAPGYKYLNKRYRSDALGYVYARFAGLQDLLEGGSPQESPFTRFAVAVHQGKFDGYEVFLNMVRGMSEIQEREERGVGRQNLICGSALYELANTAATTSPAVYRVLQQQLPVLPSLRDIQRKRARVPRLPETICVRTFELAVAYLSSVDYKGPVALSCDDSKLHAAYRTYWDPEKQAHILVGGIEGPRAVANPDELRDILCSRNNDPKSKASKLRLWCLQIPLPGIPPLILAAKAIPDNLDARELFVLSHELIVGLSERGVHVVSYACDGTETERSLQRLLMSHSEARLTHTIAHPVPGLPALDIVIPTYHALPIVMTQDSKHGLKTARNNLFSGARLLVLGNYVATYGEVRELAFKDDSPLFNRDVEKLDRQDDNAATRLFSATVLEHLAQKRTEARGLIAYLFIFGELIDAYQNRAISHFERIQMVLRARYFLDIWRVFLKRGGYAQTRYFISREAADIMSILIDGLIALIFVYRDHLGSKSAIPLLPWLHSSETCEHTFAECRKLVKDFTHLDFIFMVQKVSVMLRGAVKLKTSSTSAKDRASGYAHTYFNTTGINLSELARYPTDAQVREAAQNAWTEAESIWGYLGVTPMDIMLRRDVGPQMALPSINSWFMPGMDPVLDARSGVNPADVTLVQHDSGIDFDDNLSDISDYSDEAIPLTDAEELERLLAAEEDAPLRETQLDDRMLGLQCAAVSVALGDMDDA
ncbi:hypothetical protein EVJ58_g4673 [Rhodofomes roseus]|uniref:Ubiquitin-like protease family profile domain-containing protein n=1 Tax=Rhodofomes roseus TaxID=34475 RepID=A0A4Y9YGP3_9APHY|nr:hypothetical protein EVJ58_g4673 [Rhodofomes roseus]